MQLTRNVISEALTEEDTLFIDTLQSKYIDWTNILDDYTDWADWDDWEQESAPYNEDADYDYDFDNNDDCDMYDNELRLDAHKQPRARRFRRLRNKTFLPFRRYGNSYDGYEGHRNNSPNMLKARREALAVVRQKELQEPLRALAKHNGSWKTEEARYELRMLGYYFNWRKTIDFDLRINNRKQHALSEPETNMEAYSDNPYGKHGIEPTWRKIGTYTPATPVTAPATLTVDNEGRVLQVYGIGGGGIRTWRPN